MHSLVLLLAALLPLQQLLGLNCCRMYGAFVAGWTQLEGCMRFNQLTGLSGQHSVVSSWRS
jgi:hypothetical protein